MICSRAQMTTGTLFAMTFTLRVRQKFSFPHCTVVTAQEIANFGQSTKGQKVINLHPLGVVPLGWQIQGCAKKLLPGSEKSSANLQPAQAGHARLVLNETVTYLHTTLY